MNAPEPGPTRLVVTLSAAGLASGLFLVGVFLVTQPRIERNRAEALNRAIFDVLPGTAKTAALIVAGDGLEPMDAAAPQERRDGVVYAGYGEDGTFRGYAVPAEGPGYMDTIRLIYGFDPRRGMVVGMQVLESRETPGLGDKIITDDAFLENFEALSVDPRIVPVKKGAKARANEVDCITGATISSESVVAIINGSQQRWHETLEQASDGPGGS